MIYLCSFAKSGRTWMRQMLSHYFVREFGLPDHGRGSGDGSVQTAEFYSKGFGLIIPSETLEEPDLEPRFAQMPPQVPRIVATHDVYGPKFHGQPIIHVVRGVFDVLVSYHFWVTRVLNGPVGPLDRPAETPEGGRSTFDLLDEQVRHLNSWAPHLTGTFATSYEDMKRDTPGILRQLLKWLDVPVRGPLLVETVAEHEFQRVRARERRDRPAGTDVSAFMARDGSVGGHVRHLSPTGKIKLHGRYLATVSPEAKAMLGHFGLYDGKRNYFK
jgi:sulfotransferase family protein